jgi:hypothetical protein
MDSFVQALSLLSVSNLAARHIGIGMHARHIGTETIEIHSEIVAGVKGSKTPIQCRKRRTGVGSSRVSRQQPLGLQAGGELSLCLTSASGRLGGILGVFLDPLDRIEGVRAILCGGGRAVARGPLRRCSFRTHRQRDRHAEKQDCANKMRFPHTCSFIEGARQKGGCLIGSHQVGHRAVAAKGRCGRVLPQSVTLAFRTGGCGWIERDGS